jgi:signal transduction histidine kinase
VRTKTDLEVGIKVSPETREGLLRIVREAVINAVRHGGAQTITVHLSDEDSLRLRIEDDGIGFDVSTAKRNSRGFGLTSMQERAHSLGGELHMPTLSNVHRNGLDRYLGLRPPNQSAKAAG